MAVQATAQWWIRTDGDDDNGGGFDSAISGAGTNYSDQATAQLDLTDLSTASAGSTALTSATGGFTAAMIGNCVKLRSGTNVATGYYFVTGFTDANTVTIDRACDNGGGGLSGGAGKLGGAWGNIETTLSNDATSLGNSCTTPLLAGNQINIRGSGSNDPVSVDYNFTRYRIFPSGTTTSLIKVVGYNGLPHISGSPTDQVTFNQISHWTISNCKFSSSSTGNALYGIVNGGLQGRRTLLLSDCVIDANGKACNLIWACASGCYFKNSGANANYTCVNFYQYNDFCVDSVFELSSSATGVSAAQISNVFGMVTGNLIIGGNIGIFLGGTLSEHKAMAQKNTLVGCNIGIRSDNYEHLIKSNLLANCSTGIQTPSAHTNLGNTAWADRNAFYNNTANYANYTGGSNDILIATDPFEDSANGNYALVAGSAARSVDVYANIPGYSGTANYTDIGAVQHQDPSGGGGGSVFHPLA